MKLTLLQEPNVPETEITIRYTWPDSQLNRLVELIRQRGFSLVGHRDGSQYQIPLERIHYIDSVDGKTFLYLEQEVYSSRETLARLEERLKRTAFLRISKNCILNTDCLVSVRPLFNHRLEALLSNDEKLIITRNYIAALKEKLKGELI